MSMLILTITLAILIGILLAWIVSSEKTQPDPGKKQNKRKEQKLFAVILKDMKKNPGHWIQHGFSPSMLSAPILVNDKKNMGILYGEKDNNVTIQFNLKDLIKFPRHDTEAIITSISGKHVTKFIKTATHLLDHRGKELEYFTERLEERL